MTRGEQMLFGTIAFLQTLLLILRIYMLFQEKWHRIPQYSHDDEL
jgi:hypothetical protein